MDKRKIIIGDIYVFNEGTLYEAIVEVLNIKEMNDGDNVVVCKNGIFTSDNEEIEFGCWYAFFSEIDSVREATALDIEKLNNQKQKQ